MLFEILPEGGAVLLSLEGRGSDLLIPDEVQGQPVLALGEGLLQNRDNILFLRLPKYLQRIETRAFAGASSLQSIVFPSTLEYIGPYAFADCAGLEKVQFLGQYVELGEYAFSECTALQEIAFPERTERIPEGLCRGARALSKVKLGDAVSSIGKDAFFGAFQLEDFTWPKQLRVIEEFAFAGTGLQSFDPKNNLQRIEKAAFQDCLELGIVSLQEGLLSIGQSAFGGCVALETCIFPFSLNVVEPDAFVFTPSLTKLYVPQNSVAERWAEREGRSTQRLYRDVSGDYYYTVGMDNKATVLRYLGSSKCLRMPDTLDGYPIEKLADYAFYNILGLSSVTLPAGIESIGQSAFSHCEHLSEVRLGDGLLVIDTEAFYDCISLIHVNLPGSLRYIGEFAFFNCPVEQFEIEVASFAEEWVKRMGYGYQLPTASVVE